MDSFELNKIAGAVLAALLTAFGMKTLFDVAAPTHKLDKPAYTVAVVRKDGGAPGAATPAFDPKPIVAAVKSASVEAGKDVFKKCIQCHTAEKGGAAKQGPNLFGIVGGKVAGVASFNYSDAMKKKGGQWTYESLANYLNDPKGYIPDNKMAFIGIKDSQELSELIAYLRTIADTPAPLPQ